MNVDGRQARARSVGTGWVICTDGAMLSATMEIPPSGARSELPSSARAS